MKINQLTQLTWRRLSLMIALIFLSASLRIWPLETLGSTLAWLTFYPAVMVISIYGGLWSGLIATVLICLLVTYGWSFMVDRPFIDHPADYLGMAVFILTGSMISTVSEAMRYANRKAREAQHQAQQANMAKSAFLANMSHELRTPLNAILGYSYLMQKDTSLLPQNKEYLQIINRSGEHLLALINDVLEISKIEAEKTTLKPTNFDIHKLLEDLKKIFELKTRDKNLDFSIVGVSDLPHFVFADETKLRIILINLIGNAIKFTDNGSVTVKLQSSVKPQNKRSLQIQVIDTGVGIADNEKGQLFQDFAQTESGRQLKSGTGLGLSISQKYAKLMGGEISFKSVAGKGSTFSATIEIETGEVEGPSSGIYNRRVTGLKPGQKVPRIMVAEDNNENRVLLATLMKFAGMEVCEAINGKEAVELARSWHPDFIWMDMRMPVMDGLEATRLIKATPEGRKIIIVALSAHVLGEERKEIFEAGCDAFMGKPYKEIELFDCIAKNLNLKFRYEETPSYKNNPEKETVSAIDLHSLNDEFCNKLNKAVTETDAMKISELAENIQHQEPELAVELKKCARNFDYDRIRMALDMRG